MNRIIYVLRFVQYPIAPVLSRSYKNDIPPLYRRGNGVHASRRVCDGLRIDLAVQFLQIQPLSFYCFTFERFETHCPPGLVRWAFHLPPTFKHIHITPFIKDPMSAFVYNRWNINSSYYSASIDLHHACMALFQGRHQLKRCQVLLCS